MTWYVWKTALTSGTGFALAAIQDDEFRLAFEGLGQEPLLWLGAGSFSLIATLAW